MAEGTTSGDIAAGTVTCDTAAGAPDDPPPQETDANAKRKISRAKSSRDNGRMFTAIFFCPARVSQPVFLCRFNLLG
jgi:hypothetical protein